MITFKDIKYEFLPEVNSKETEDNKNDIEHHVIGDSACPCCEYITIPNKGDALAYICPICFWEMDSFIKGDDELSDQNHGLTLIKGKQNYKQFGAVLPQLKKHCRPPKENEYPTR